MSDELLMLVSGLIIAVGAAVLAAFACLTVRRRGSIWPRSVRWDYPLAGWMVLAGFLAFYVVPGMIAMLIEPSGFYQAIYGKEFPPLPKPNALPTPEEKSAATIRQLWTWAWSFPIVVAGLSFLRRYAFIAANVMPQARTPFANSYIVAFATWLVVTPIVFLIYGATIWIWGAMSGKPPDPHPLTLLGPEAGWRERGLLVLQAAIIAPILEEMLFRGLLLPWLLQRPRNRMEREFAGVAFWMRPHLIVILAIAMPLVASAGDLERALRAGQVSLLLQRAAPALFVIALVPVYWYLPKWRWLGRRLRVRSQRIGRGIVASSMMFAAVHGAWPSPVPLFALALALSYAAVRTRGVIAPILMHSFFNAVSVLYLLFGGK